MLLLPDSGWSSKELSILRVVWLCFRQNIEKIGHGLSGPIYKVRFNQLDPQFDKLVPLSLLSSSFVVKSYCVFDNTHASAMAHEHIEQEMKVYVKLQLNKSSSWPALHYAGTFDVFRGLVLEFVDGRVVKFSKMSQREKDACKAALRDLHNINILHGDMHYRNFILTNSEDTNGAKKAIVIDFGCSQIAAKQSELNKEEAILSWKLEQGDDSMDQDVRVSS
jgi:serine/threonine protein kinase